MITTRLPSGLTRLAARAACGQERIVLSRGGRPVAAIVPLEDLRALEHLDALEDEYWVKIAEEAMADPREEIPFEQVLRECGLSRSNEPG